METKPTITPLAGHVFKDTIDGYFPLHESLRQMMERQGFRSAIVSLCFAPAMEIPNLAPHDPVPLYVTDGFGCMINRMTLIVRHVGDEVEIEGLGNWKWFGGPLVGVSSFSPLHRLAEPAFIKGVGFKGSDLVAQKLGQAGDADYLANFVILSNNNGITSEGVLNLLGWPSAYVLFGDFTVKAITRDSAVVGASKFELAGHIDGKCGGNNTLILCRGGDVFETHQDYLIKKHWLPLDHC